MEKLLIAKPELSYADKLPRIVVILYGINKRTYANFWLKLSLITLKFEVSINDMQIHHLHDSYESYELTRTLPWKSWNDAQILSIMIFKGTKNYFMLF